MDSALTNFPNGATSFGIPLTGGQIPVTGGNYLFVAPPGSTTVIAGTYSTLANALAVAVSGDVICVLPGTYTEQVSIPRSAGALTIVGCGNLGEIAIVTDTANEGAISFDNDNLTLINIDLENDNAGGAALKGTGSRLRAYGCKFESADAGLGVYLAPGTVAQEAAGTAGRSGDNKFFNCEFAWSVNGFLGDSSDFGAATQIQLVGCVFQNVSGVCIGAADTGGIGGVRNLEVTGCTFDNMEDGTAPSKYVEVANASDTGTFSQNNFALATNAAAKLDIGAKVKWPTNYTEAGPSTARPA